AHAFAGVAADDVAGRRGGAADRVALGDAARSVGQLHARTGVPEGRVAGHVGADQVSLNQIVACADDATARAEDVHAAGSAAQVACEEVARDRVVGAVVDFDARAVVAQGDRPRLVGADVVALDQAAGGHQVAVEDHAVSQVPADDISGRGGRAADGDPA